MAKQTPLVYAPPKILSAAYGLSRRLKIDPIISGVWGMAVKINWSMVGPSIQALVLGVSVIAAAVTLMQKQDALAASVNKDVAIITDKVNETNTRVDKLYDLLVYPQVTMGNRQ